MNRFFPLKQLQDTLMSPLEDDSATRRAPFGQISQELRNELELISTPGGRIRDLMNQHFNKTLMILWVILIVISSYASGFFKLNIFVMGSLLSYVLWNVMKRMRQREERMYIAQLHHLYRSVTMNADFEDAEWINTILVHLWSVLEPVLSQKIVEALQPILNQVKFKQYVKEKKREREEREGET
jgi:Ca2+-dependent lipid-binding protein